ncbi:MAG: 4Fe-4S binding protein [Dehalococcoidia bacterium]
MTTLGWRETSPGGVITEAGNAVEVDTGSWRTSRPVIDWEACTHCLICWVFCPDSSFPVENGKLKEIDLEHCKGCGICAIECPRKCIVMVPEADLNDRQVLSEGGN